jgi:hypothetical protein
MQLERLRRVFPLHAVIGLKATFVLEHLIASRRSIHAARSDEEKTARAGGVRGASGCSLASRLMSYVRGAIDLSGSFNTAAASGPPHRS